MDIIYGKDNTEGIVSMDTKGDALYVYREVNGEVLEEHHKLTWWALSNNRLDGYKTFRLQGDLFYKYSYEFKTKNAFMGFVNSHRNDTRTQVYSCWNDTEANMLISGRTYFKGMEPKDVSVLSFDIESMGLNGEAPDAMVLLISTVFRKNGELYEHLFAYDDYETQGAMLQDFCSYVRECDPSIILGHNIIGYDIPYMYAIAMKEGITLDLGRDGSPIKVSPNKTSKFRKSGGNFIHYQKSSIFGREIIDTMFLAIKADAASMKYESYGLKAIIKCEKLERADRQYYDASKIRTHYKNPHEWKLIKDYCIHDAEESLVLFDKLIKPYFYMTQSIPKPFQIMNESATGSQVNSLMVRAYLQQGHSIPKPSEVVEYEGAISRGEPGIYKYVNKLDVSSLYPSIILSYGLYNKVKDPKGIFLELVKVFTAKRLEYKKLHGETGNPTFDALSGAFKILINSMYGYTSTPGLHFNSPETASFITARGRDILNIGIDWVAKKGFILSNVDTDSYSYSNGLPMSPEMRQSHTDEVNSLSPNLITWCPDGYFDLFVVLRAKNYYMVDSDGKTKTKGSALKSGNKEVALKELMGRILANIQNPNEIANIYSTYIKEAMNIKDISRWCSKKSISEKTLTSTRTNESKIRDALGDTLDDIQEGEKIYVYFQEDGSLSTIDKFDGTYDRIKMVEKVWKTVQVFENVLDGKTLFPKYSLRKNRKLLEELIK